MNHNNKTPFNKKFLRGFTLIELLVVISIIGLLASVVLSSLQSARDNARQTAIIAEANELFLTAQQAYTETGTYFTVSQGPGWVARESDCDVRFSGSNSYGLRAREICKSIMSKLPTPQNSLLMHCTNGTTPTSCPDTNARIHNFAITVKTENVSDYGGQWYCVGSSGAKQQDVYGAPLLGMPGCYWNP